MLGQGLEHPEVERRGADAATRQTQRGSQPSPTGLCIAVHLGVQALQDFIDLRGLNPSARCRITPADNAQVFLVKSAPQTDILLFKHFPRIDRKVTPAL